MARLPQYSGTKVTHGRNNSKVQAREFIKEHHAPFLVLVFSSLPHPSLPSAINTLLASLLYASSPSVFNMATKPRSPLQPAPEKAHTVAPLSNGDPWRRLRQKAEELDQGIVSEELRKECERVTKEGL